MVPRLPSQRLSLPGYVAWHFLLDLALTSTCMGLISLRTRDHGHRPSMWETQRLSSHQRQSRWQLNFIFLS